MAALLGLQRSLSAFGARGQGVEQVAKFAQRAGGDQRRAQDEGSASGIKHPRGQRASGAAFQLDENDVAAGNFLASVDRQALSVEGVPAVVDPYNFGFGKMMGIM
jgi:hypothetical protein